MSERETTNSTENKKHTTKDDSDNDVARVRIPESERVLLATVANAFATEALRRICTKNGVCVCVCSHTLSCTKWGMRLRLKPCRKWGMRLQQKPRRWGMRLRQKPHTFLHQMGYAFASEATSQRGVCVCNRSHIANGVCVCDRSYVANGVCVCV